MIISELMSKNQVNLLISKHNTHDLNPSAFALCGFKSHSGYHGKSRIKSMISSVVKNHRKVVFLFLYSHFTIVSPFSFAIGRGHYCPPTTGTTEIFRLYLAVCDAFLCPAISCFSFNEPLRSEIPLALRS